MYNNSYQYATTNFLTTRDMLGLVVPSAYENEIGFTELLTKLMKVVKTYISNTDNLNEEFKLLVDYINNYFENLDVQEEIDNKMDEFLANGVFKKILAELLGNGYVYGIINVEDDFEFFHDATKWVLAEDITIKKSHYIEGSKIIDLNGHTIKYDESFGESENAFYMGFNDSFVEQSRYVISFKNGVIDCNNKTKAPFAIEYAWNLSMQDLMVINNGQGLIEYYDNVTPKVYGASIYINHVSIRHREMVQEMTIGIDSRFTDSTLSNCQPIDFHIGMQISKGTTNIDTCHPWGHHVGNAKIGQYMRIGFLLVGSSSVYLNNCISDTVEKYNKDIEASYQNGGIHYYIQGANVFINNCNALVLEGQASKPVCYWVSDYDPIQNRNFMTQNVNLNNCIVSCSNGQKNVNNLIEKAYKEETRINKPTILNCNFNNEKVYFIDDGQLYTQMGQGFTIAGQNIASDTDWINFAANSKNLKNSATIGVMNGNLSIISKDNEGNSHYMYLREKIQSSYNATELKALETKLAAEISNSRNTLNSSVPLLTSVVVSNWNNTGYLYVPVMFNESKKVFYDLNTHMPFDYTPEPYRYGHNGILIKQNQGYAIRHIDSGFSGGDWFPLHWFVPNKCSAAEALSLQNKLSEELNNFGQITFSGAITTMITKGAGQEGYLVFYDVPNKRFRWAASGQYVDFVNINYPIYSK